MYSIRILDHLGPFSTLRLLTTNINKFEVLLIFILKKLELVVDQTEDQVRQ